MSWRRALFVVTAVTACSDLKGTALRDAGADAAIDVRMFATGGTIGGAGDGAVVDGPVVPGPVAGSDAMTCVGPACSGALDGSTPAKLHDGSVCGSATECSSGTCTCGTCCTGSACRSECPSFRGLGLLNGRETTAYAISANGQVVVGITSFILPFKWSTTDGMQELPLPEGFTGAFARKVTANGKVIVGDAVYQTTSSAVRWDALGVQRPFGDARVAFDVSDDGTVAVGMLAGPPSMSPFIHRAGMFVTLPTTIAAAASVVSGDGSTIAGKGFRWSPSEGALAIDGDGSALTRDGAVLFGINSSGAFRWTSGAITTVPSIPGYTWIFIKDVTADGRMIVGTVEDADKRRRAAAYDGQRGARLLHDMLAEAGISTAGWTLESAAGVSADGSVVAGTGIDSNGTKQAFRAVVP